MTDKELVKLLIDNTNDLKTQKLLASLGYYPSISCIAIRKTLELR